MLAVMDAAPKTDTTLAKARQAVFDEYIKTDMRLVTESISEVFRWLFLIVIALLNNLPGLPQEGAGLYVNWLLVGWALSNFVITLVLVRGRRPGKVFVILTSSLDLLFGCALVFVTDGFSSPFFLAFFLVVIAASIRYGLLSAIISGTIASLMYIYAGYLDFITASPGQTGAVIVNSFGRLFLIWAVAMAVGLMARQLIREREQALGRASEFVALYRIQSELAGTLDVQEVFALILRQSCTLSGALASKLLWVSPQEIKVIAEEGKGTIPDTKELLLIAQTGRPQFLEKGRAIAAPLARNEGAVLVLHLSAPAEKVFSNRSLFMVTNMARPAAIAVNNALTHTRRTQALLSRAISGHWVPLSQTQEDLPNPSESPQ